MLFPRRTRTLRVPDAVSGGFVSRGLWLFRGMNFINLFREFGLKKKEENVF